MGAIINVNCKSCGTDWQCKTGCGIMHASLDGITDLFSEETRKEIYDSVSGEYPLFHFSYELARCAYCRDIIAVPVLCLADEQKEYIGECIQCGKKIELIRELPHTSCPICEKEALQAEEVGLWD